MTDSVSWGAGVGRERLVGGHGAQLLERADEGGHPVAQRLPQAPLDQPLERRAVRVVALEDDIAASDEGRHPREAEPLEEGAQRLHLHAVPADVDPPEQRDVAHQAPPDFSSPHTPMSIAQTFRLRKEIAAAAGRQTRADTVV